MHGRGAEGRKEDREAGREGGREGEGEITYGFRVQHGPWAYDTTAASPDAAAAPDSSVPVCEVFCDAAQYCVRCGYGGMSGTEEVGLGI